MRIILVSCFLLSTCCLTLATEYVEGVYDPQPSRIEKRFIFNKSAHIQRLIQGLTSFSSISNSNSGSRNIPFPPPAKSTPASTTATTARPPIPDGSGITIAFPDDKPTTAAPDKTDTNFDRELDYLTQHRDNAYALPETAPRSGQPSQSKSTVDRLPPLPENQSSDVKQNFPQTPPLPSTQTYTQSYSSQSYSTPQQYSSAGLNLGVLPAVSSVPLTPQTYSQSQIYSQPLSYLPASQSHLAFLPAGTQTFLPQQHVIPAPQISPVTYQTQQQKHLSYVSPVQSQSQTQLSYVSPVQSQSQAQLSYVSPVQSQPQAQLSYVSPVQSQSQTHFSYVSPVQTPLATISAEHNQYQSLSNDQFSFSNNLLNSAHTQTTYFGNTHSAGSQCACKNYK